MKKNVKTKEEIKSLQEKLSDLGIYNGEINGNYKSIIDTIAKYQLEKKIVKNKYDVAIGYFGPKTRKNLMNDYKKYLTEQEEIRKKEQIFENEISEIKKNMTKKANKKLEFIGNSKFGEISHKVRELQKTLHSLGYFHGKDTAIFGNKTKQAIIEYQLEKNIITNIYETGAGYIGPKTRKSLKNELENRYLLEEISKNKELANYYKSKLTEIARIKEEIKSKNQNNLVIVQNIF